MSLERGTRISDSRIRNAIVGRDAVLIPTRRSTARCWAIAVVVNGFEGSATLGDHSELTGKERS